MFNADSIFNEDGIFTGLFAVDENWDMVDVFTADTDSLFSESAPPNPASMFTSEDLSTTNGTFSNIAPSTPASSFFSGDVLATCTDGTLSNVTPPTPTLSSRLANFSSILAHIRTSLNQLLPLLESAFQMQRHVTQDKAAFRSWSAVLQTVISELSDLRSLADGVWREAQGMWAGLVSYPDLGDGTSLLRVPLSWGSDSDKLARLMQIFGMMEYKLRRLGAAVEVYSRHCDASEIQIAWRFYVGTEEEVIE